MQTTYFGDVENRVEFARGYLEYYNSVMMKQGMPSIDPEIAEKRIRKQHAKFYGMDSKYDGKGNLR